MEPLNSSTNTRIYDTVRFLFKSIEFLNWLVLPETEFRTRNNFHPSTDEVSMEAMNFEGRHGLRRAHKSRSSSQNIFRYGGRWRSETFVHSRRCDEQMSVAQLNGILGLIEEHEESIG